MSEHGISESGKSWFGVRTRLRHGSNVTLAAVGVALALLASPPEVVAQQRASQTPAHDVAGLRFILRSGDTVVVTTRTGEEVRAEVVGVLTDPDAVLVAAGSLRRTLREGDIEQVHVEVGDPLTDGVLRGVGWSLGGALVLTAITKEGNALGRFGAFALLAIPVGAGLGAAIDSAHKDLELVFQRPVLTTLPGRVLFGKQPERMSLAILLRVDW